VRDGAWVHVAMGWRTSPASARPSTSSWGRRRPGSRSRTISSRTTSTRNCLAAGKNQAWQASSRPTHT
jgi:hypothetical protein